MFVCPAGALAQGVSQLHPIGDLSGGIVDSEVAAVSADGSRAVGTSVGSNGPEAFYWTEGLGMVGIGRINAGHLQSQAQGVSANGAVIVGTSGSGGDERAYRWSGSFSVLDTPSCSGCDPITSAVAISPDGLVVVGAGLAKSLFGDPHLDALRWPGGGTADNDLGDLPGPAESNNANGASQTGSVIVGGGQSNNGTEAWVWNGSGTMTALAALPGALIKSSALAVSADGSTIVGHANSSGVNTNALEAVRWTGASWTTVSLLGSLPGATSPSSRALAVSNDGSLIVGHAQDQNNDSHAFIWDATNGMRDLNDVLVQDYGVDLTGWVLREATGISAIGPGGELTIVGNGTNPTGDPEGWLVSLVTPECRNGVDDGDADTAIDHPADPECTSPVDYSEDFDCSDGLDNDLDGLADALDPDCTGPSDQSELPDCSDGFDNDGQGGADWPADPGCRDASGQSESPACDDQQDNDLDLATDFPADTSCVAAWDQSETPDCSDGLDNDGDGQLDHPSDSDCDSPGDASEDPECFDAIDNDGNGKLDYPADVPSCESATDAIEAAQCQDGVDNDGDLLIDHPLDTDCAGPSGLSEAPFSLAVGQLLALDRSTRTLFQVDRGTGAQTRITREGYLTAPQGLAQHSDGVLVVADPAGLIEILPEAGVQEPRSAPLDSGLSLQVVFDSAGDPLILEADGISALAWNASGLGTLSSHLPVPTPGPIPTLGQLTGDTLLQETSGDLVLTGVGLFSGGGFFRVDHTTQAVSKIDVGWSLDVWQDLALEASGTSWIAVGIRDGVGPGVYRVDAGSGLPTALNTGPTWVAPTGVAVAADNDDIYVADAGSCTGGVCTGGAIYHVDPLGGGAMLLCSGGFIEGEMDLLVVAYVPEPAELALLASGLLLLAELARRRAR